MMLGDEYMVFRDREEAGQKLAERLQTYANRKDVIVLGIPRGGVPVAFEVAKALDAPLDIFLSRKLGVPGHEELAFGALATGDTRVLDREIIEAIGISEEQIDQITARVKKELERRENALSRRPAPSEGRRVNRSPCRRWHRHRIQHARRHQRAPPNEARPACRRRPCGSTFHLQSAQTRSG